MSRDKLQGQRLGLGLGLVDFLGFLVESRLYWSSISAEKVPSGLIKKNCQSSK